MSCRSTAAGSALTTYARLTSGLTDVQTLSAFHALRAEGRGQEAPTDERWQEFIEQARNNVLNGDFTDARRRSLLNRLATAEGQRPDGATFHALRRIAGRAARQTDAVNAQIADLAGRLGVSEDEVRSRYRAFQDEIDRQRGADVPEGYDDEAIRSARDSGMPEDRGSVYALHRLRQQARRADADRALTGPQRIVRETEPFASSRVIAEAGYDPDGGRLEVVFRRRDGGASRVYAYRDVPQHVWEEMRSGSAGVAYNAHVRNNSDYRYEDQEAADLDSAARRCTGCGQFAAASHACPALRAADVAAAVGAPAPTAGSAPAEAVPAAAESALTPVPQSTRSVAVTDYGIAEDDDAHSDQLFFGRVTELRRALRNGQAEVPYTWVGPYRRTGHELGYGGFTVQGTSVLTRGEDGQISVQSTARCDCWAYQQNGDCPHVSFVQTRLGTVAPAMAAPPQRAVATGGADGEPVITRLTSASREHRGNRLGLPPYPGADYYENHCASQDRVTLARPSQIRAGLRRGQVDMPVRWSGYRYGRTTASPSGNFTVTGNATLENSENGIQVAGRSLRCTCAQYRENYDCPHVNYVGERIAPAVNHITQTATPQTTADAQAAAEAAVRQDWMRSEQGAAEARARWAATQRPEDSYSNNFAAFEQDYQAALDRQAAGESPVPYMRENATGGLCAPGGRRFGVELEFDFPATVNRSAALEQIGREMYAAGLTRVPHQTQYHSDRTTYFQHERGWKFERDCTVSGEIISPAMEDTPETWEKVNQVCDIIRRNGGIATARTGSHVHVSAPNTTGGTATELLRLANQHEDVIYRVSQNPERGQHRPMRWCGPNTDVPPAGYASASEAQRHHNSHGLGVNLQSVSGGSGDHAEIRHWDGTLDPAVIQTQVKISAAMLAAAERNGNQPLGATTRGREQVGSHAVRQRALLGARARRALTSEELAEDTATARSFADTLFTRREDKAQFAALFAITKWHRASSR